jgi:hypothetical protein
LALIDLSKNDQIGLSRYAMNIEDEGRCSMRLASARVLTLVNAGWLEAD